MYIYYAIISFASCLDFLIYNFEHLHKEEWIWNNILCCMQCARAHTHTHFFSCIYVERNNRIMYVAGVWFCEYFKHLLKRTISIHMCTIIMADRKNKYVECKMWLCNRTQWTLMVTLPMHRHSCSPWKYAPKSPIKLIWGEGCCAVLLSIF